MVEANADDADIEFGLELEPEEDPSRQVLKWSSPPDIRNGFVRKVYGILSVQLVTTALVALPFVTNTATADWIQRNPQVINVALLLNLIFVAIFACCPRVLRQYPKNYIILGAFTLCEGFLIGNVCVMYNTVTVATAFLMTGILVGALTVFAVTTKSDFTGFGPYLYALLWAFILAGALMWLLPAAAPAEKLYAAVGVIFFAMYLVYDTQIIVGGRHRKHEIGVDDYAFGALLLYMDIIQIFLEILRVLGKSNE